MKKLALTSSVVYNTSLVLQVMWQNSTATSADSVLYSWSQEVSCLFTGIQTQSKSHQFPHVLRFIYDENEAHRQATCLKNVS